MSKEIPWSFSKVEAFELCPKKFYHANIARDVQDVFGHEAEYGKEVHKAFELRLVPDKKGKFKPLPLDLQHHEKVMKKLFAAPGDAMPEQKLAINKDMEPTGFFDNDVWGRGVVDYLKINGDTMLIIDHKTGRPKDGFDQVRLMAAMMSCYMPHIKKYIVAYYWTKTKQLTVDRFSREEITTIWSNWIERVNAMQDAIRHDDFPATPNFLCKRHCGCKGCPHNG